MRSLVLARILGLLVAILPRLDAGETFTVVTYNLQNYLLDPLPSRAAKPVERRDRVVEILGSLNPDVLVVQEIGGAGALEDLANRLAAADVRLPHREIAWGADPAIAVAVLSRFPFESRRSHTNDMILAEGRMLRTSRGFVEVRFEAPDGLPVTLLAAHLKSKRETGTASEASIREAEARVLRQHVDTLLGRDPQARIVVAGDLNDHQDSRALRFLRSRGPKALFDLRPKERGISDPADDSSPGDAATWTHHYVKEDSYGRFDYILVSPALRPFWRPESSYVPAVPGWSQASDHRPVVATFGTRSRRTPSPPRRRPPRRITGRRRTRGS